MPEPTAFVLTRHFTNLINRRADFKPAPTAPENKLPKVYGIYSIHPGEAALVLKADLALMGSMAGAMVGLPEDEVAQRLRSTPLDELIQDAMHEVCNVASGVLAFEGRAVFKSLQLKEGTLKPNAQLALKQPKHRAHFTVDVEGYSGGLLSILE
jgi:hypothetical protein